MNRSIPRIGLLIPRLAWPSWTTTGAPAWPDSTGIGWSAWPWAVMDLGLVPDPAVAGVEDGPLGADFGQAVEVVWRRRGARRPLEGVALPRIVAGVGAVAARDQ